MSHKHFTINERNKLEVLLKENYKITSELKNLNLRKFEKMLQLILRFIKNKKEGERIFIIYDNFSKIG